MLRKGRYLHVQFTDNPRCKGFSAFYTQHDTAPDEVKVAFTRCSREDFFHKAKARDSLVFKMVEGDFSVVKVVDLPKVLAALEWRCYGENLMKFPAKFIREDANRYAWVWKYFL